MNVMRYAAVLGGALLLAACGAAPEKSIEKDCVRLGMLSQLPGAADQKKSCACFAGKLKADMSKDNLKALAKAMKDSKTESEFEGNAQKQGLSDAVAMSVMGAAKACAMGS
jgi:hypothetical protein